MKEGIIDLCSLKALKNCTTITKKTSRNNSLLLSLCKMTFISVSVINLCTKIRYYACANIQPIRTPYTYFILKLCCLFVVFCSVFTALVNSVVCMHNTDPVILERKSDLGNIKSNLTVSCTLSHR